MDFGSFFRGSLCFLVKVLLRKFDVAPESNNALVRIFLSPCISLMGTYMSLENPFEALLVLA